MKKIFYLLLTTLLCFQVGQLNAQDAASKWTQAGLTFNAGANFLSPSSNKIEANRAGSLLSIGLNVHSALIATGLEFDFGKNIYSPTSQTFIDYIKGDAVLTKDESISDTTSSYLTMQLVSRKVSTTKLTIPIMLLFRTDFIGYFRYFGKFGLRNSFILSHAIEDVGIETTLGIPNGTAVTESLMQSPREMFIYNGSVGISGGAEWNFVGSTSLVLEAGYFYGFTPYFLDRKDGNKTMYTYSPSLINPLDRNYYSASARQNQLIFKLSILF